MAGQSIGTVFVELDLDPSRYVRGQQSLLKSATATTLNIEQNFKNLGIKSSAEFDLMRQKIQNSYAMITNSGKASANDILRAEEAKNNQIKRLNTEQHGHQTTMVESIKKNWIAASVAIYAAWNVAQKAIRLATVIFEAGMEAQQMKKAFSEIAGGAKLAEKEFAFLRATSDKLGQNFWALQGSYKSLLAASQSTTIAGQQTRDIFEAVAKASTTLGLSSEKTKLTLYAVEQMMSKGKISAEELRRQMGDNLPGAFSLAAKAMGMTTYELDKALKAGTVMADDFLPKFARVLRETYSGEVAESVRATNKLEEAWMDLKVAFAEGGFADKAIWGIKQLTESLKGLQAYVSGGKGAADAAAKRLEYLMNNPNIDYVALSKLSIADQNKHLDDLINTPTRAETTAQSLITRPASRPESISQKALMNYVKPTSVTTSPVAVNSKAAAAAIKEEQKAYDALVKTIDAGEQAAYNSQIKYEYDGWKQVYQDKIKAQDDLVKETDKGEQEMYKAWVKYEQDSFKTTEKYAKDKADAYRTMYGDMKSDTQQYYNFQLKTLDKEKRAYEDLKVDQNTVDKWYLNQKKKIDQNLILSSNDFFAGLKVGYDKSLENQMTWAKSGEAIFNSFAQNSKSTLSDVLFDGIKGDLKSFEDYWDSFFDSLLRTFTDTVAEMATQKLADAVVEPLVGFVGGAAGAAGGAAWDWLSDIDWFHSGAYFVGDQLAAQRDKLSSDEVMAILQKGEMVIPKDVAEQIRTMMGGGTGGSADPFGGISAGAIAGVMSGSEIGGRMGKSYGGIAVQAGIMGALTGKMGIGPMSLVGPAFRGIMEAIQESYGIEVGSGRYSSLANIATVALGAINPILGLLANLGISAFGNYSYTKEKADILSMNPEIAAAMAAASAAFGEMSSFEGGIGMGPGTSSGADPAGIGPGTGFGFRTGGISRGPESGYSARLHGTELVVSQKKDVPVRMKGGGGTTVNFNIGGNLIGDKQNFNDFVEQIDYVINKKNKRVYAHG